MNRVFMAVCLALAACVDAPETGVEMLTGQWAVTMLDGEAIPDGVPVTMEFSEGGVAGQSGCNRYTASLTQANSDVTIGPAAMTRMACPPAQMAVEARFGAVLGRITRLEQAAEGVLQFYAGDQLVMRAARN